MIYKYGVQYNTSGGHYICWGAAARDNVGTMAADSAKERGEMGRGEGVGGGSEGWLEQDKADLVCACKLAGSGDQQTVDPDQMIC
jgi:hypothetical protein